MSDDNVDGIYWGDGKSNMNILEAGDVAVDIDGDPLPIEGLKIEREGYRGDLLVVAAECGAESEDTDDADWAGIYLTNLTCWLD